MDQRLLFIFKVFYLPSRNRADTMRIELKVLRAIIFSKLRVVLVINSLELVKNCPLFESVARSIEPNLVRCLLLEEPGDWTLLEAGRCSLYDLSVASFRSDVCSPILPGQRAREIRCEPPPLDEFRTSSLPLFRHSLHLLILLALKMSNPPAAKQHLIKLTF